MLARFHVAEEVTRSPIGVQTRQNLDSSPGLLVSWSDSARTCGKLVAGVVPASMSPAARQIVSNLTGVLVQAAHPKRIILFGSQAKGDAAPHSDFDIMVVEENPGDRFAEMVRLNRLIRSFDIAVDLLVVSDEKFQYWRETPGNVYYEAATAGQVLYQAA